MLNYFNLNKRARRKRESDQNLSRDCESQDRVVRIPALRQVIMYCSTLLGVLFSTAVHHFGTGDLKLTLTYGEVIVSGVIALMIIPVIYEKLELDVKAPFIVQIGLFVQNGVFWQVLIESLGGVLP